MNEREQFMEAEGPVRRFEYDDGTVLVAADVGPGREVDVDVLEDTVIVVTDDGQYEFDLPEGREEPQAFMKNGVLTVEVSP